jgi:hypothetical protein
MRPGGGKQKGSAFERQVGAQLSAWVAGGDEKQLIRTVLSGGWKRAASDWRQVGDLASNGPAGEQFRRVFAVECKRYRVLDWWAWWLWDGVRAREGAEVLPAWWARHWEQCQPHGLVPLLVCQANRRPVMGILPDGGAWVSAFPNGVVFRRHDAVVFPLADLLALPADTVQLWGVAWRQGGGFAMAR